MAFATAEGRSNGFRARNCEGRWPPRDPWHSTWSLDHNRWGCACNSRGSFGCTSLRPLDDDPQLASASPRHRSSKACGIAASHSNVSQVRSSVDRLPRPDPWHSRWSLGRSNSGSACNSHDRTECSFLAAVVSSGSSWRSRRSRRSRQARSCASLVDFLSVLSQTSVT